MITYEELKNMLSFGTPAVFIGDEAYAVRDVMQDAIGKYALLTDSDNALRKVYADVDGVFNNLRTPEIPNTDAFQAYLDAKRKEQEDADGTSKVRAFRDIVTGMADLYAKKNKDYGDSFGQSFKEYGAYASTQRLHDKLNRIKQLLKSGDTAVKTESVIDTLTDLACYAIMLRIEIESVKSGGEPSTENK
jgi:hypothetical protein